MRHPWDRRLGVWYVAEDHTDLPAVLHCPSGEQLTFGELAARAHQVVHAVRAAGIEPGQTLVHAMPNGLDVVIWQLAAQEGGWRYISLNPALSGAEIRSIVDHSGAVGAVVHADYAHRVGDVADAAAMPFRVSVGGDIAGFTPAQALLDGQPATAPEPRVAGGPFIYTSGTTGKPKGLKRDLGAAVDPWAMADAMKSFGHAFQFQPLTGAHLVSAGMHHGGCQGFYLGALNVGQALVIMEKFDAERALELIEKFRITTAYMVPTQFVRLLRLPEEVRNRYDHSSLGSVVHSAAPCPLDIKRQMFDWWGPVIWETYGGMEGAATIAKPHRWLERPGTVGRSIKGMRVKILDDDGAELGPGGVGNVYLEPTQGSGFEYHNDPEATAAAYRGKAFTLGDIGYLDADGYLFINDRAKDMIISGGVNIYPAEVESVLAIHPAVADVAVIGVPDDEWGESVAAVVELVDGSAASDELAQQLIRHCRDRLAGFKCPRSVDFRASLSRTDSGKLAKRDIRQEYWAAAGRSV